jgi:hypothetical protein
MLSDCVSDLLLKLYQHTSYYYFVCYDIIIKKLVKYPYFQKSVLLNTKSVKNLYVSNLLFCGNKYRFPEGDLIFCSIDGKPCAVARFIVVTTSEMWEENSSNRHEQRFKKRR